MSMSQAFPLSELLWMHTVAVRRRTYASSTTEFDREDEMVCLLSAAIAELVVKQRGRIAQLTGAPAARIEEIRKEVDGVER